jgi:hypothetical protein
MIILIPYGYIIVIGIFYYRSLLAKREETRTYINVEDTLNHLPIMIELLVYGVLTLLFGMMSLPFWIAVFLVGLFIESIQRILKKES